MRRGTDVAGASARIRWRTQDGLAIRRFHPAGRIANPSYEGEGSTPGAFVWHQHPISNWLPRPAALMASRPDHAAQLAYDLLVPVQFFHFARLCFFFLPPGAHHSTLRVSSGLAVAFFDCAGRGARTAVAISGRGPPCRFSCRNDSWRASLRSSRPLSSHSLSVASFGATDSSSVSVSALIAACPSSSECCAVGTAAGVRQSVASFGANRLGAGFKLAADNGQLSRDDRRPTMLAQLIQRAGQRPAAH